MDRIYSTVSSLVASDVRLLDLSMHTQSLVGMENVILWNKQAEDISPETYNDFVEAIKKRGMKYYKYSYVLSYADFCIILLYCTNYLFNHETVPLIPEKSYTAAWRALEAICTTGNDRVIKWMTNLLGGRNSAGYSGVLFC